MDRRFVFRWALLMLLAFLAMPAGCNRKSEGPPSAQAGGNATTPEGDQPPATSAHTHRPVIIGSDLSAGADFPSIAADPSRFSPVEPFPSRQVESPLFPAETAAPVTPVQSPTDRLNPLRADLAVVPQAAPRAINPLRTARSMPRMAAPPSFAPEAAAGAEPPAAAPPPELPAFTASPPAGGSMAVEAAQPLEAAADAIPFEPPATGDAPPASAPQPLAAAVDQAAFDVVKVFYGTDRLGEEPAANDMPAKFVRFLPAGCSLLLTLCLALVAAKGRNLALWMLTVGGVGVSLGLSYQAASQTIVAASQSSKEGLRYSAERSPGGTVDLGLVEVTIPRTHVVGEVESPSILRLEVREDAAKHVVLRKTERLADERFYGLLRERVAASPAKELFVFIHGFNVSFEDAARRTAQIHHDLRFAGAPIFFSWPANNKFVLTYAADETNVAWSAPHLKQFLLEVTEQSGAESINLIAHSMGNRALAAALREIELELKDEAQLFNQVILAAPDLDAETFRSQIAPSMQRTAKRLTLYASSRDDALRASQLVHRGPRAGDAGPGLVVVNGVDTIDVTAIDTSPWGHSYYGSSDPVLQDLKALFASAIPPNERTWLSPVERDGLTYWIFQPVRTAGAGVPLPR